MLRLYILRHVKTGMALPGQRDFDRRINERGQADLALLKDLIASARLIPSHVYCSPAERTRATLAGISGAFDPVPAATMLERMYHGSVEDYLEILRAHPRPEPLMIIGHNPMCEALANLLSGQGDEAALRLLHMKYPTGGLAVIDIPEQSWAGLREGAGHLSAFHIPSGLRDAA